MPRKLLRAALAAAVLSAMLPQESSAQTASASKSASKTSAASAKSTPAGASSIKTVAAAKATPTPQPTGTPADLEPNRDIQMLLRKSKGGNSPQAVAPVQLPESVVDSEPAAAPPAADEVQFGQPSRVAMDADDAVIVPAPAGTEVVPAPVAAPIVAPYPYLAAPLYPSPRPGGIPLDVGATMITNPAFAPHEMTYRHQYRGLYAPFYYKTTRFWIMTPLGIHKSERRTLTGTEVRVKYKSHIGPFSFFFPPVIH